ncbi:MAG: DNA repair protein RadA [Synergistetes bacterium]|nr:DNA repair protein RadA [Synergistota bacterium]MDW8191845.1 DNA repair protein RadA [Synergistota bacterium]
MVKSKLKYVCQSCGYETIKWMGSCPQCGVWGSFIEKAPPLTLPSTEGTVLNLSRVLEEEGENRIAVGIEEFDRVLGGGIVKGSVCLLGGEPGIGKSTLLLQIAGKLSSGGKPVFYVSAEESIRQVALRARRLGIESENLYLVSEIDIEKILNMASSFPAEMIVIDSIQTVQSQEVDGIPGSIPQVRECAQKVFRFAKEKGISAFIVGHVTKEGTIAGPKLLEHLVDVVLYFEGDKRTQYRMLRSIKNRYGSTLEMGIFEMTSKGLREVKDVSAIFLSGLSGVPGGAVGVIIEGERPIVIEIQALVAPTFFPYPKRVVQGFDFNRFQLLIAVLEKRIGLPLGKYDVYLNIVGGLRTNDPALDVPVCCAIFSSYKDIPLNGTSVFIGEIGLLGEVRPVSFMARRITEACRQGFLKAYVPKLKEDIGLKGIELFEVRFLSEIFEKVKEGERT